MAGLLLAIRVSMLLVSAVMAQMVAVKRSMTLKTAATTATPENLWQASFCQWQAALAVMIQQHTSMSCADAYLVFRTVLQVGKADWL